MARRLKFNFNGAKLRDLRTQRGLSRSALAKLLNSDSDLHVSDKSIGAWETGKSNPSFEAMREISYRFGIKDDNYWKSDGDDKKSVKKKKESKKDDKPIGLYVGIKSDIKGLEEISAELDEKINKLEKLVKAYEDNARHLEHVVGKYKRDMDDGFYRLGEKDVELQEHIETVEKILESKNSNPEDYADFAASFMVNIVNSVAKGKLQ